MIPKTIHYCWFGGKRKPKLARKCIKSWKKHLKGYEFKEWNEKNFDLDRYPYVREAYDARRFAFVTDVVRLYALYHEGGIYMDTDVEVLRPLEPILNHEVVSGFESSTQIPTGLMASREGHPLMGELLDWYEGRHFLNPDGTLNLTTNVQTITDILTAKGFRPDNTFQTVGGMTLYPSDYLCPKSWQTGEIHLTENTYTIHHFSGSWLPEKHLPWKTRLHQNLWTRFHQILKAVGLEERYMRLRRGGR